MRANRKMCMSAMVVTALCWGVVSCRPHDNHVGSSESATRGSEEGAEMKRTDLSREQILDAANRAARDHGIDPDQKDILYDEGNAIWRAVSYVDVSDLSDHDYQAVAYFEKLPTPEGGLWVLVDRKTGRVLRVVELD